MRVVDRGHLVSSGIGILDCLHIFSLKHIVRLVGVAMALYPLSAFRAMSAAALNMYQTIKTDGTQKNVVDAMQTRMELYDVLGYQAYEDKLDALFQEQGLKTGEQ